MIQPGVNKEWDIGNRKVTTVEAVKAQKYLLNLPERYVSLSENMAERARKSETKWVFDPKRFDWLVDN